MKAIRTVGIVVGVLATAVALAPVVAAAQAEKSLEKCQKTVGKEIGKYVASKQKAIAKCLDKIAKERIKDASGDAAGAAKGCAGALRKIVNTEKSDKTLAAKTRDKIEKTCDETHPKFKGDHVDVDILADDPNSVTVAGDAINASPQMAIPCFHFGGDGSLASSAEWLDCLIAMADAQAIRQVHLEYPNADAWLRDVRPDIDALDDPNVEVKITDALAALDSVRRWVDNGDGTVTDYVTGLMWEKKDDSGGIHDKDDFYTWNNSGAPYPPDGTAFSVFLDTLNGGATGVGDCDSSDGLTQSGGFAGHCDWRLPTVAELQTILLEPYPCGTTPCIDQDVFGPTVSSFYWSATTVSYDPSGAWGVFFFFGDVNFDVKPAGEYVRAVRGGL